MKNYNSKLLNEENIVSMYFNDINDKPLLSEEEERELAIKCANGDKKARETLVDSNLRFVIKIAKEYQGMGLSLADLISEGNIGLLYAVDKYKVSKGTRFVSYAIWWIRQSILKAVSDKGRLIRLPQNRVLDLMHIKSEATRFENETGRSASDEELSERVNISSNVIRDIRFATMPYVSLDAPMSFDGDGDSSKTFIKDSIACSDSDFLISMEEKEKKDEILSLVNSLPKKESEVIKMRFGLDGYSEMSLQDIGEYMSLTKERIRQIEKVALGHLKEVMSEENVA